MTEFPITEPVVDSWLGPLARALQMEFSDHPAIVAGIGNQFGDDGRPVGEALVSVAGVVNPAWVETAHEAGPAGRADRALTISVGEGRALVCQ